MYKCMYGRIFLTSHLRKTVLFIITIHAVEIIYIFLVYVTNWGKQRFIYHAVNEQNSLDVNIRENKLLLFFKTYIKNFL